MELVQMSAQSWQFSVRCRFEVCQGTECLLSWTLTLHQAREDDPACLAQASILADRRPLQLLVYWSRDASGEYLLYRQHAPAPTTESYTRYMLIDFNLERIASRLCRVRINRQTKLYFVVPDPDRPTPADREWEYLDDVVQLRAKLQETDYVLAAWGPAIPTSARAELESLRACAEQVLRFEDLPNLFPIAVHLTEALDKSIRPGLLAGMRAMQGDSLFDDGMRVAADNRQIAMESTIRALQTDTIPERLEYVIELNAPQTLYPHKSLKAVDSDIRDIDKTIVAAKISYTAYQAQILFLRCASNLFALAQWRLRIYSASREPHPESLVFQPIQWHFDIDGWTAKLTVEFRVFRFHETNTLLAYLQSVPSRAQQGFRLQESSYRRASDNSEVAVDLTVSTMPGPEKEKIAWKGEYTGGQVAMRGTLAAFGAHARFEQERQPWSLEAKLVACVNGRPRFLWALTCFPLLATRPKRIVVSYAREDWERHDIKKHLQQASDWPATTEFLFDHQFKEGRNWRAMFERWIDECDGVWLFWSVAASQSDNVRYEYETALDWARKRDINQCKFLCLKFLDEQSKQLLPPELSDIHWNHASQTAQSSAGVKGE